MSRIVRGSDLVDSTPNVTGEIWPTVDDLADYIVSHGNVALDIPSTIPRQLNEAFSDLLSVQWFGAQGDGATDETSFFNAAKSQGGMILIPQGDYNFAGPVPSDNGSAAWLPAPSMTWAELTDSGKFSLWRGRYTGSSIGANIWRLSDRVFVGGAASKFAGNDLSTDAGTSWLSDAATAPRYLGINAGVLFTTEGADPGSPTRNSPYGFVAGVKTSVCGQGGIGFGAAIVNDRLNTGAWGAILELQHEPTAGLTLGLEVGAKHKGGAYTALNAYNVGSGVMGLWMAGGGDSTFGGSATLPANTAMVVLRNANAGAITSGWARGIVMKSDSLEGTDGSAASTGVGVAMALARRHAIEWGAPTDDGLGTGAFGFRILSSTVNAASAIQMVSSNSMLTLQDRSGNAFFQAIDGGDDYLLTRSSTGQGRLDASGPTANIDITFVPKGTGLVKFGTFTVNADAPITGYISIKDSGGTTRKLAVIA